MAMACDRVKELAPGFVLGSLEPDEMIEIQDHLDRCAKPHPEIEELGGVLGYLAILPPPSEPPAWLRDSVIAAASADLVSRHADEHLAARKSAAPVTAVPRLELVRSSSKVVSLSARRRAIAWVARAAAVVALIGLAGFGFGAGSSLVNSSHAPDELGLMVPGSRVGVLNASDTASKMTGYAVLQPSGHMWVRASHLPATTGDEAYVVWLMTDNGSSVKVGSLQTDSSGVGLLEVSQVPDSTSLWLYICREPNANVDKSTGPKILTGSIPL